VKCVLRRFEAIPSSSNRCPWLQVNFVLKFNFSERFDQLYTFFFMLMVKQVCVY